MSVSEGDAANNELACLAESLGEAWLSGTPLQNEAETRREILAFQAERGRMLSFPDALILAGDFEKTEFRLSAQGALTCYPGQGLGLPVHYPGFRCGGGGDVVESSRLNTDNPRFEHCH